ncbi:MAG: hypothetical protein R3A52_21670 [Polyangiales bacterium]
MRAIKRLDERGRPRRRTRVARRRAERAILDARPREQVERLLTQLIERAEDGSRESCFAHRHLAELRLEDSPWSAALHLRRVIGADPDDDVAR